MKVISAFFTERNSKLTVMCEHQGSLRVVHHLITKEAAEKTDHIELRIKGRFGLQLTLVVTKEELSAALRQNELDYAEWKALNEAGQETKSWSDWATDRLKMRLMMVGSKSV
jgi:hypothetical protein